MLASLTRRVRLIGVVTAAMAAGAASVGVSTNGFGLVGDSSTVAPTDSQTVEPTETPDPTETRDASETPKPPKVDAISTTVTCPEGVKNHGEYVSGVAKSDSEHGRDHGKAVSEAAKSDCGKTNAGLDASEKREPTESEAPDATEAPETHATQARGASGRHGDDSSDSGSGGGKH